MIERMIIEFLKVKVKPGYRQQYMEAERKIWSAYLSQCEGFINKEVWLDPEDESILQIRILWNSKAQWKALPPKQLQELDVALTEQIGSVWQIVESQEFLYVSSISQDAAVLDQSLL
jgi:uncharacterized protein (TIGR03792 family)